LLLYSDTDFLTVYKLKMTVNQVYNCRRIGSFIECGCFLNFFPRAGVSNCPRGSSTYFFTPFGHEIASLSCLLHKKVGKKSHRSIKIAGFATEDFLPAEPKLTPPSSSLGQGSSRAPATKTFLEILRDFSETARATA